MGVVWHGPGPNRTMYWDDITGLELRDSHVLVGRMGFHMPRRLQTKLVFKTVGEDEQELFEPGTRSRKKAISRLLKRYAPDRLNEDLKQIIEKW